MVIGGLGGARLRSRVCFGLVVASVAILASVAPPGAGAVSPPSDERAELVFSNGGRIVSIKADGSERKVLTRKSGPVVAERVWDAFIPVRDSNPSISPDGTKLLFKRNRDLPRGRWSVSIVVANRDGSNQKEILTWKNIVTGWLGWGPGNRVVVVRSDYRSLKNREIQTDRVLSYDQAGGDRKVLLTREPSSTEMSLKVADFSPDGSGMLYSVDNGRMSRLRELNLVAGTDRLVLKGTDNGSYSPDGTSIAFTTSTCWKRSKPVLCEGRKKGVWTARSDGSPQRRLLGDLGRPSAPDWSPDGKTLAFSSTRNFPGVEAAEEIYSIGVDGGCLTWLTNGSPASTDPSWGPEASDSSSERCGAAGRTPLVEVGPSVMRKPPSPRLWAGPSVRGRLLSSISAYRGSETYYYEDCGFYDRAMCREGLVVQTIPSCNPGNVGGEVELSPFRLVPSLVRGGALLYTSLSRRGDYSWALATGGSQVFFGESWVLSNRGKPINKQDGLAVLDQLRPVGQQANPAKRLPRPAISRSDWRRMKLLYRVYRKTGSFREAAQAVDGSVYEAKWAVRWKPVFDRLRPARAPRCRA